jgi:tRNA(His) 5'-end guanylyltransferase
MKLYENCYDFTLPIKTPVIIRVDGRSFHSLKLNKPFDQIFIEAMIATSFRLFKKIQNAKLAYTQSDEISLVLIDYETKETQPWFGNRMSKMISISSAIASTFFSDYLRKIKKLSTDMVEFDSRVFILPMHEVENYFIQRYLDCVRNSISSVAQSHFSDKMLKGKKNKEKLDMLFKIGVDFYKDYSNHEKFGTIIVGEETKSAPETIGEWKEIIKPLVFMEEKDESSTGV